MTDGMAAPIIVTATFVARDQAWLNDLRRHHFPPERNHLDAHLTLFHHLPPSLLAELDTRLRGATASSAPDVMAEGPMNLGRGTALRIRSAGLDAIRRDLAETFAGVLTPQDAGGWRAHVTVQNKVEPADARRLQAELGTGAWPRPLMLSGLAAWWYRGGPWEPIRNYRFRG